MDSNGLCLLPLFISQFGSISIVWPCWDDVDLDGLTWPSLEQSLAQQQQQPLRACQNSNSPKNIYNKRSLFHRDPNHVYSSKQMIGVWYRPTMRQQDSMIIHHGSFKSDPFYQHKCQFRLSPDLHFLIPRLFIQRIIAFIGHFLKVLSTIDYLFEAQKLTGNKREEGSNILF